MKKKMVYSEDRVCRTSGNEKKCCKSTGCKCHGDRVCRELGLVGVAIDYCGKKWK